MGRVQKAAKNIFFGYISNFMILILGFWQRDVFIRVLGETLLGVNTLYADILSVLSLAELGVGTALNYSLYKPVANRDREKIKSYMRLYKKAYLTIACVIAVIGIAITPFLPLLIKAESRDGLAVRELVIYYLIFLFNTVSTYFVAYKYSLVNAEQKDYIQTNITTITKIITVGVQIVVLYVTKSFLLYLLAHAVIELLQKVAVSIYLNHLYPYLRDRKVEKLTKEETDIVVTKSKALMFHKIGDVARLQTDSIIITYFIDVASVGFVGNYNYVITYGANFINLIFNSVISGLGNLVATESKEKQYSVFKVYRFFACWLYGFAAVGFWLLLTPLVTGLWLDESWKLGQAILTLILIDFYFKGGRVVLLNYKIAAGVFEQDKYLALIQGGVNLVISIVLVQKIGLMGVYIGTIVSGLIANVTKPVIIYKVILQQPVKKYFVDSLKYLAAVAVNFAVLSGIKTVVMPEVTVISFGVMFVIVCVVFNASFLALFGRTEEFGYLWGIVRNRAAGNKKRL